MRIPPGWTLSKAMKMLLKQFLHKGAKEGSKGKHFEIAVLNGHPRQRLKLGLKDYWMAVATCQTDPAVKKKKTAPVINRKNLLRNSSWKRRLYKAQKCCDLLRGREGWARKHRKQNSKS